MLPLVLSQEPEDQSMQHLVYMIFTGYQFDSRSHLIRLPSMPLRFYILPYWSNPSYLIFGIWALWRSDLSARALRTSKIKKGGLDEYGAKLSEQQQFAPAGIEGVKTAVLACKCQHGMIPQYLQTYCESSSTFIG